MKILVRLESNAKVNLSLDILRKRPDGFHEVEFVMQEISLHDEISLKETGSGIKVSCTDKKVPVDEKNLCWQAVQLVQEKTGIGKGVEISIKKNIPLAAGLGGGSSNAAAVLKGLNELWKLRFSKEQLKGIALEIGMDVPFFIEGGTAFAFGRGEKLEPLPTLKKIPLVVCNPGIEVSTKWAYSSLDYYRTGKRLASRKLKLLLASTPSLKDIAGMLHNDFEFSVLEEFIEIRQLKEKMVSLGALNALMSGSGSTVFGITESKEKAQEIASKLKKKFKLVWVAGSVNSQKK